MDQQFLWAKPRNRQQQLTRNIKCVKILQLTTFSFDSNNLRDCFQTKLFFFNYANCAVQHGPALALRPLSLTLTFFGLELNPELRKKNAFASSPSCFDKACGNEFLHRDGYGYGYEWWLAGSFNCCWPQVVYAVVMHIQKYSHGNKHCPLLLLLNILGFVVKCCNYRGSPETIQIHRAEKAECQAIVAAQSCHTNL